MIRLLVFLLLSLKLIPARAQSEDDEFPGKITCYSYIGNAFPNNTQCPGSNVCCQTADLCNNDRFCLDRGQIIVPACSSFPWNNCANICQYDSGTGFLPRATNCTDGSFCCDNDATCCAENRGIVLNGLGAIVSTDPGPLSTSSTSASTSSRTSSTAATVITTTQTPSHIQTLSSATSTASSAADIGQNTPTTSTLSAGVKAGIAVAAVAAVAGVITAVWLILLLMRRRRTHKMESGGFEQAQGPVRGPGSQWKQEKRLAELGSDSAYGGHNSGGHEGSTKFPPISTQGSTQRSDQYSSPQHVYEMPN